MFLSTKLSMKRNNEINIDCVNGGMFRNPDILEEKCVESRVKK